MTYPSKRVKLVHEMIEHLPSPYEREESVPMVKPLPLVFRVTNTISGGLCQATHLASYGIPLLPPHPSRHLSSHPLFRPHDLPPATLTDLSRYAQPRIIASLPRSVHPDLGSRFTAPHFTIGQPPRQGCLLFSLGSTRFAQSNNLSYPPTSIVAIGQDAPLRISLAPRLAANHAGLGARHEPSRRTASRG